LQWSTIINRENGSQKSRLILTYPSDKLGLIYYVCSDECGYPLIYRDRCVTFRTLDKKSFQKAVTKRFFTVAKLFLAFFKRRYVRLNSLKLATPYHALSRYALEILKTVYNGRGKISHTTVRKRSW